MPLDGNSGYFRLATSLMQLKRLDEALRYVSKGLQVDPANASLLQVKRKCEQTVNLSSQSIARGLTSLYGDKFDMSSVNEEARANYKLLEQLIMSVRSPTTTQPHELQGIFSDLSNPSSFRQIVYAGCDERTLANLPKTLKELLEWPPVLEEVMKSLSKISDKANSVLEGVKKRARSQGEEMDPQTENMLRPQVLQEAFARELIEIVKRISKGTYVRYTRENARLASVLDPRAAWLQLDDDVIQDIQAIATQSKSISLQRRYLGSDWAKLILDDVVRFDQREQLQASFTHTSEGIQPMAQRRMRWIEMDAIVEYPALVELLENMYALSYELNSLAQTRLAEPTKGCTLLVCYDTGTGLSPSLDNPPADGLPFTFTFTYQLVQEPNPPAQLTAYIEAQGSLTVEVENDCLCVHSSTHTYISRTPANTTYYCVYYFASEVRDA